VSASTPNRHGDNHAPNDRDAGTRLLLEIARCPVVSNWFDGSTRGLANPCRRIIGYQRQEWGVSGREEFQLPEPWRGHLADAPLLFVSSNPSISAESGESYPRWHWADERIVHYFDTSFETLIVDGAYARAADGKKGPYVAFWGGILAHARALIGPTVVPGRDYALTEVVHCKSRQERGVGGRDGALLHCTRRYLQRVLAVSSARVVITLGSMARAALVAEFRALRPTDG
jgi:hypothetical protein